MEKEITRGEIEYDKLVVEGKVDKKLLEHPQFKKSFIREYNFFDRGNLDVALYGNRVVISGTQNIPEATNGTYHGYENYTDISFSIVGEFGEEYLSSVRNEKDLFCDISGKSCGLACVSKKGKLYDDFEEVGVFDYSEDHEISKGDGIRAVPNCSMNDLGFRSILNAAAPKSWNDSIRFRSSAASKILVAEGVRDPAIITFSTIDRSSENVKDWKENYGYAHGDSEFPERVPSINLEGNAFYLNGQMRCEYETLEDALKAYSSKNQNSGYSR